MRPRRVFICLALFALSAPAFAGYRIAAWIPGWDPNALTSVQLHAGSMSESNPTWYNLNSDGTIAKKTAAEDPTWRAAMTGTALMPTIQNNTAAGFDATLATNILSTASSRESHAEAIRQLVAAQAYDGIDVDYERLPLSARSNFTAFVQLLASKLHADGKKLSVTVSAKTSDSATWDGPGAEDYAAIGAVADWVKLMVYDYSWSTSAPGAITPLSWLDACVGFAVSQIPASRVVVGLPWYGYDWPSTGAATGVTYQSAMNTAQTNAATITHDINGEATYTYSGHTVYFLDASGHDKQIDLILQKYPAVAGFCYWRMGSEDPAVWTRVQTLVGGTTIVTPPAAPSGLQATAASWSAVSLTWVDSSANETGFRVMRCTGTQATCDASPSLFTQIAELGANVTGYQVNGLAASTTYTFRVRSFNAGGVSADSASASATTAAKGKKR